MIGMTIERKDMLTRFDIPVCNVAIMTRLECHQLSKGKRETYELTTLVQRTGRGKRKEEK